MRTLAVLLYSIVFFVVGMYFGDHDRLQRDQATIDALQSRLTADSATVAVPFTPITERDLRAVVEQLAKPQANTGLPDKTSAMSLDRDNDAMVQLLPGQGVVVYKIMADGEPHIVWSFAGAQVRLSVSEAGGKSFTLSWPDAAGKTVQKTERWDGFGFVDELIAP